MNYDVIGDIHGHAGALEALLTRLGYRQRGGVWRQAGHMAVFVGDYIDRGPRQLDSVSIVRSMVDAGTAHAVMGNHEFNAMAWHMRDPDDPGQFLRPHTPSKQGQHQAFLDAVDGRPDIHHEILDWFKQLPLWLDLPGLRAVHACWDAPSMATLAPYLDSGNRLTQEGMVATSRHGSDAWLALERVLKGPEIKLPDGIQFRQGDQMRSEARIRWWNPEQPALRDAAIVDAAAAEALPDTPVPDHVWARFDSAKPIFIGHYWMRGQPQPLKPGIACLDYSVARDGPLVAYRMRGESVLNADHYLEVR